MTGGTGSLGHAIVEKWHDTFDITVLSRDEDKQSRMMQDYPDVVFKEGDVRNMETCIDAVRGQDIVIHAAALKRIEMCEMNPWEAVQTNVIGTYNIVHACKQENIPKMVLISTDKCCKPINVYGMTKAVAERITTSNGYNCVRYGNVNNSRGSVIPYWNECKKKGLSIKLTHPDMTRFLIDYDHAINLIVVAMDKMNGDVFIPKLEAARLKDVAHLFSEELEYIGERPCEKINEELINEDEFRNRVEETGHYYIIHKDNGNYKTVGYTHGMRYASDTTELLTADKLRKRLSPLLR